MRSKQDYWLYVKNILMSYPKIKEQQRYWVDRKTAEAKAAGEETTDSSVAQAALEALHPKDRRRLKAIEDTMAELRLLPDGERRIKVIELVYFKRTHTLLGASALLHLGKNGATGYSSDFIRSVYEKLDLP